MTQIIFDIKRTNGYGKEVYTPSMMDFSAIGNADIDFKNFSFPVNGPTIAEVAPSTTFCWQVTEKTQTSGGTPVTYRRYVNVPDSSETINYLDLLDVDPNEILANMNINNIITK